MPIRNWRPVALLLAGTCIFHGSIHKQRFLAERGVIMTDVFYLWLGKTQGTWNVTWVQGTLCVLYNPLLLPCFLWSHERLFLKYMLICLFTLQTAGSVKCIFTPCCFWTWWLWHPNLTSVKRANHNSASEREKKVCEELVSASSTGWSHPCCLCTKKEFSAQTVEKWQLTVLGLTRDFCRAVDLHGKLEW